MAAPALTVTAAVRRQEVRRPGLHGHHRGLDPFGLAANRPTIEALIRYAYDQKIIPAKVRQEEVFVADALEP